jgi:exodeoxyribonuclease-5
VKWSPQQAGALDAVSEWLRTGDRPYFYLAGYAGTGKTTLAKHFAEGVDGHVAFGSFTGKAASVMRDKGCTGATTIHRLIYESRTKSSKLLHDLQMALRNTRSEGAARVLRLQIQEEIEKLKQPHFQLNPDANLRDASLVIIDECSMVNAEMGRDLLSFGVPILVLGDPAQLPPVFGGGFFMSDEPDFMMTEIHRQAQLSGILKLATDVRQGRLLDYCDLGDAVVIHKADLDPEDVPDYDQVLVGRNKTRYATNRRMRDLIGRTSKFPQEGDRLVCLRNNHNLGLLNGEIYEAVDDARVFDDGTLAMEISDGGGPPQIVEAWQCHFLGEKPEHYDRSGDTQEFDYGYVLTVHKAQGSQWPGVLVFDESRCFRGDWQKWLYTAITRAADHLTVIK